MSSNNRNRTLHSIVSDEWITQNQKTFDAYDYYRHAADIMEQTKVALGRVQRPRKLEASSTTNSEGIWCGITPATNKI